MKDTAPVAAFGIALMIVVVGAIVISNEQTLCHLPQDTQVRLQGGWCVEFWLNRYQTLVAGLLTLVAAGIAAFFVLQQTQVARRQLSAMVGDLEPDILIRPRSSKHGFVISIINHNRRPMEVVSIGLADAPDGFSIALWHPGPKDKPVGVASRGKKIFINIILDGARPTAAVAETMKIEGVVIAEAGKLQQTLQEETPSLSLKIVYLLSCVGDSRIEVINILMPKEITRKARLYYAEQGSSSIDIDSPN